MVNLEASSIVLGALFLLFGGIIVDRDSYIKLQIEDINKYLNIRQKSALVEIIQQIEKCKENEGEDAK